MLLEITSIGFFIILTISFIIYTIYNYITYVNLSKEESSICPLYSCGISEDSTTHIRCRNDDNSGQPLYAYRLNKNGDVECQKDKSSYFEEYKKNE